jgi:hypothetical protein
MEDRIEVRIDVSARSVCDVYFWQNGRRSDYLYLYGPEDEYLLEGNPIPENMFAWVKLTIQRKKSEANKIAWKVVYKSNVVDSDLREALERVKRKIETAIKKGVKECIVLNDDLTFSEWETALPQAEL